MPRIFRPGPDLYHAEALGRLVAFQRADDEALPYADVSDAEAADLLKQAPSLYALAWADVVGDDDLVEPAPKPVRRKRVTG